MPSPDRLAEIRLERSDFTEIPDERNLLNQTVDKTPTAA
jgi:hypothetical protein